jgi:hypothetical protein
MFDIPVDSYLEANQDDLYALGYGTYVAAGQCFTTPNDGKTRPLTSIYFYLSKTGSPTGTLHAKLYALTGTYGTDGKPTGSALATSTTALSIATISAFPTYTLYRFDFDGSYVMAANKHYVATVEATWGTHDNSNYVNVGVDASSPTHGGNASYNDGSWGTEAGVDACFYVFTQSDTYLDSGWEDSGGTDVTDGGKWTEVLGGVEVSTAIKHHGAYALKDHFTGTYSWEEVGVSFPLQPIVWLRNYYYFVGPSGLPPANGNYSEMSDVKNDHDGDQNSIYLCLENIGGTVYWTLQAFIGGVEQAHINTGVTVPYDTWICTEICRDVTNSKTYVYINGVKVIDVSQVHVGNNQWCFNGNGWFSWSPVNLTTYLDCTKISTSYIGPEGGATLQSVTDSVGLSDSVLRHKTLLPITQVISLSDAVLLHKGLLPISDVVGLVDAILRHKTLTITDGVGASDAARTGKNPLIVADVVSLADLVNVITGAIIKTVADAVGLADVALVNKSAIVADVVGVLDQVFRHKPSITVADAVSAVEVVLVMRLLSVADSVSLADALKVLKTLNVSDGVSLVDVVSTPSRILRALDQVGLADGVLVNKVLQVTENISLVEVVEVGTGGAVKKTKLFLILGELALQLTGD